MSPSSRIVLTLSLSTVAGLVLAAVLVFGALDRLRVRAAESNIDFVLTQLQDSVESSVSLGLALPDVRIAQDLIERVQAGDPDILAVEIFSPSGISVFNTDRGSLAEPIPDAWLDAVRRSQGRWQVEELGAIIFGDAIRNDFGERVGGIAVTASGDARDDHADALVTALLPWLLAIGAGGGVIVAATAWLLLGAAGRDFRQAARRLLAPAARPEPARPAPTGEPALPDLAAAMRVHVADLARETRAVAAAVQSLDEDDERDAAA